METPPQGQVTYGIRLDKLSKAVSGGMCRRSVMSGETNDSRGARPRTDGSAYDVVVIGGGPAGSAAATFLAFRGLRCLVLEQARFPRYTSANH